MNLDAGRSGIVPEFFEIQLLFITLHMNLNKFDTRTKLPHLGTSE